MPKDKYRPHSSPSDEREFRRKSGTTPSGKKYEAQFTRLQGSKKPLQSTVRIESPITSRTTARAERFKVHRPEGNVDTYTSKEKVTKGMRRDSVMKKGADKKVSFAGGAPKIVKRKK